MTPLHVAGGAQPDISIRAKPPSPKRLSRTVLLVASGVGGLVIAFASISGLSERPDRRSEAAQNAVAAAGGPPESIAQAKASYDAGDLPFAGRLDPEPALTAGATTDALAPPADPFWSGERTAPPADAVQHAPPQPDPQDAARTAPILFGERRAPAQASSTDDRDRLDARLSPPRSRYELQAGHLIPAALVTALNSDLPGRVIAHVTANVFDSVSGDHLLIPQGARLIGTYRDGTRYGDRRILLVWNRLILPNGWSIDLKGMEATDPGGAAGLTDRTDNHLDRLAAAVALSSIISVVANEAEDDDDRTSLSASLGDAAAQEAARTGARIVDRELTARPTLRVRAGAPVRVLVSRDIQLRPYRGASTP